MGTVRWREETQKSEDSVFAGLNGDAMAMDNEKGVTTESQPLRMIW
jgi:hypothetical protein